MGINDQIVLVRLLARACATEAPLFNTCLNQLILLQKHAAEVTSITFSADGDRLAGNGADDLVRLWRLHDAAGLP
jgi:WD40 repeat protein